MFIVHNKHRYTFLIGLNCMEALLVCWNFPQSGRIWQMADCGTTRSLKNTWRPWTIKKKCAMLFKCAEKTEPLSPDFCSRVYMRFNYQFLHPRSVDTSPYVPQNSIHVLVPSLLPREIPGQRAWVQTLATTWVSCSGRAFWDPITKLLRLPWRGETEVKESCQLHWEGCSPIPRPTFVAAIHSLSFPASRKSFWSWWPTCGQYIKSAVGW